MRSITSRVPNGSTAGINLAFCFWTFWLLSSAVTSSAYAEPRPNLLVIAIDDLRDYLGCYGAEFVRSPNIDRLAKRGVVFERGYCQVALCGPSRSSVFTGLRPDTLGARGNRHDFRVLAPDVVSLPEFFKQHGYRTQGIGKILHNTHRDPRSWTEPFHYPLDPQYASKENLGKRALIDGIHKANRQNPLFEAADVGDLAYRDGLIRQLATASLKKFATDERPFLLMVGFHKPHSPFNAPKKYWDLYERESIPLAENQFPPRGSPDFASQPVRYLRSFQAMPEHGDFPEPLAREITHAYLACVSYIDSQVGHLLDTLRAEGLEQNTIVLLWSDHGYQLGHHNLWCKHSNYEAATKAPLIIADPRQEQRRGRVSAPVELLSIYPTLVELAGFPPPKHCEGRSLARAVAAPDEMNRVDSVAFSQFNKQGNRGRSARTTRFRITEWRNQRSGDTVYELFDHSRDPLENRNVASEPAYAEALPRLKAVLATGWQN